MKTKYNVFLVLALFTSCSHDFDGPYEKLMKPAIEAKLAHPEIKEFDGEVEPPLPDLKENRKTVLGVDVNKNGIRDDVEIYINRTYSDTNIRRVLKQYVRDHVAFINSAKFNNINFSNDALEKESKTLACLDFVYPGRPSRVWEEIDKLFYNEKFRDDAFGKSQRVIGSHPTSGVSSTEYLNYDKFCEFKINEYEKTREKFLKVWDVYMGKKK